MKSMNGLAATSFVLGVVSVFAFQIIVLPLTALFTGIVAAKNHRADVHKGRWMAVAGIVLGALYSLLGSLRLIGF